MATNNRAFAASNNKILEISDLVTRFYVDEGTVHAVNGVSLVLHEGETLALVGESGSGKSVTMLSVMGLIPKSNGEIVAGSVVLDGQNLLDLNNSQLCDIRGKDIAMVFQDPMTSLNPVMSIGRQIEESLSIHLEYGQNRCPQTGGRVVGSGGHPRIRPTAREIFRTISPAGCASG